MSVDIIVFSGKQGAGKTTITKSVMERARQLGYDFVGTLKFADVLYELHDYILNKMETYTGVSRRVKDGNLLQLLGTEWGRKEFGPDVWSDILIKKINKLDESPTITKRLIVIDDCRFENEFKAMHTRALMVRLECPESIRRSRADSWRENTAHPSETGLDKFAEDGEFDLYLDTSTSEFQNVNINHCVSLVMSEIQRGSWKSDR